MQECGVGIKCVREGKRRTKTKRKKKKKEEKKTNTKQKDKKSHNLRKGKDKIQTKLPKTNIRRSFVLNGSCSQSRRHNHNHHQHHRRRHRLHLPHLFHANFVFCSTTSWLIRNDILSLKTERLQTVLQAYLNRSNNDFSPLASESRVAFLPFSWLIYCLLDIVHHSSRNNLSLSYISLSLSLSLSLSSIFIASFNLEWSSTYEFSNIVSPHQFFSLPFIVP